MRPCLPRDASVWARGLPECGHGHPPSVARTLSATATPIAAPAATSISLSRAAHVTASSVAVRVAAAGSRTCGSSPILARRLRTPRRASQTRTPPRRTCSVGASPGGGGSVPARSRRARRRRSQRPRSPRPRRGGRRLAGRSPGTQRPRGNAARWPRAPRAPRGTTSAPPAAPTATRVSPRAARRIRARFTRAGAPCDAAGRGTCLRACRTGARSSAAVSCTLRAVSAHGQCARCVPRVPHPKIFFSPTTALYVKRSEYSSPAAGGVSGARGWHAEVRRT